MEQITQQMYLAGSYDYITISGQTITRNQINLTTDVTVFFHLVI